MTWASDLRARIARFESLQTVQAGELGVSIKVRASFGCFHREHSPHPYGAIDGALAKLDPESDRFRFEECESGPEILVCVTLTATGIVLAESITDLLVAILAARSEGVRKGDDPSAPLEVVVRRYDDGGRIQEEVALTIDHIEALRRTEIEKRLVESLGRLTQFDAHTPRLANKQPTARRGESAADEAWRLGESRMVTPPLQVYIPAEEGAGPFYAPVPCRRLPDGWYQIFPDDYALFDDDEEDEGSQLYMFGPGDIVSAETEDMNGDSQLVARTLLRSGSNVNDLKRLMYVILEENPEPSSLIGRHGKDTVRRLLDRVDKAETWVYPRIREYVAEHRSVLKEAP